jgi:dTDP-4-amino-4,6-dideoxygalactose transaminase
MSMNTEPGKIPFHRPLLGPEEESAVLEVLRSGWLTTGSVTKAFEDDFARFTGVKYALAVNSATSGLHLALESYGVGPGDRVIMSPLTFTASAEVVRYLGAEVRFADIEADDNSWNLDPGKLEQVLKTEPDAKAIMPVHVGGRSCDMASIKKLAEPRKLWILEDAAHAFPVKAGDRFIGTLGDAGVYSFYATKTMTAGEGGMIATDNPELAKRISVMRLHGIDRDVWARYSDKAGARSWEYDIVAPGFKYNLTDIASALGRVQLKKSQIFLAERKKMVRHYLQELSSIESLILPPFQDDHAWHLFVIQLKEEQWSLSRDEVMERLFEKGIGVSVHFKPLHLMTYWKERYHLTPEDFPESLKKFRRSISLPLWPGLPLNDQDRIISVLKDLSRRFRR